MEKDWKNKGFFSSLKNSLNGIKNALKSERNLKIQNSGSMILENWIKNEPYVDCVLPTGGTTAFIQYLKKIPSVEFCKELQKNTGVALLPGENFEYEGFARLGFCAENLEHGLNLITNFLH